MNQAEMDALRSHLDRAHEMKRDAWVWGFSEWGKEMLVFVACTAARRALPKLDGEFRYASCFQELSGFRHLLEACEQWFSSPDETHSQRVGQAVSSVAPLFGMLDSSMMELGGEPEENAFYAASACVYAGYTVLWCPEWVDRQPFIFNADAEREAQLKAGPALEVVKAVSHACYALDWMGAEMKDFLAAEIRKSPFLQPAVSVADSNMS